MAVEPSFPTMVVVVGVLVILASSQLLRTHAVMMDAMVVFMVVCGVFWGC